MPGQVYSVSTLGGNHSVPYLTDRLRHRSQPMFRLRQFCDVKEAIGKKRGDTFNFDKAGNVATQGGTLVETATIPETQYVTNQGTATITEYGNSVSFTGKLDSLGQFELSPTIEMKLRDDQVKVLESAAAAQFVLTQYIAVCTATNGVAITTNGTATATATGDGSAVNNRAIVDFMKKKFIPKFDGSNYICVASVSYLSGMHSDTGAGGWVDVKKYTDANVNDVIHGEVGSFYGVRFVEETGYLSNVIGNGSTRGQALYFGSDNVYEAMAIPEEIRVKISGDYGRDMGLAWYALLGFKIVWDHTVDTEQHIVFVTSA
jgi:N4-gp56 family major capsid protein